MAQALQVELPTVRSGKRGGENPSLWKTLPEGARPWAPGQSGNPSGRSRVYWQMEGICREKSPDAARKLVELMECDDPRVAGWAADKLMTWGWGKPRDFDPASEQPDNPAIDPSQFTPAQRKQLRRMLEMLLKAMPADTSEPEVIDGNVTPES